MRGYTESVRKETKMHRFGKASGIAAVAFSVAGAVASFVTGQALAGAGRPNAGHSHRLLERMGLV
jgi:hypothetical protein